jgi:hypothetical protein
MERSGVSGSPITHTFLFDFFQREINPQIHEIYSLLVHFAKTVSVTVYVIDYLTDRKIVEYKKTSV